MEGADLIARLNTPCHGDWISAIRFFPDDKRVVVGAFDGGISVWDLDRGERLSAWRANQSPIRDVAIGPSDEIFTVSEDGSLRRWDAAGGGGDLVAYFGYRLKTVSVASDVIAVGGDHEQIQLLDRVSGNRLSLLEGHSGWVRRLQFIDHGTYLISCGDDGTGRVWDLSTHKCISVLEHGLRVWSIVADD